MDRPLLVRIALATCVLLAGCEKHSALYCGLHPTDHVNCPGGADGGGVDAPPIACTADNTCMAPTAHCDLSTHECVGCVDATQCSGTTPVCTADHACHGCETASDCLSAVCMPDGSCAAETDVAYVDSMAAGDNPTCSHAVPCQTLGGGLAASKPIVKLMNGPFSEATTINNRDVAIIAEPGVKLVRTGIGSAVLSITGTSHVAISALQITGSGGLYIGASLTGSGSLTLSRCVIDQCAGGGVSAQGGTLIVSRSTVQNNSGGGILVGGSAGFDVTNTFIVRNGGGQATAPGAALACGTGTCRFEFNTVADNTSRNGAVGGVQCDLAFEAPNNVIAHNRIGFSGSTEADTGGACTYPSSTVTADLSTLRFVGPTDYHLTSGSIAIDTAVTPTTITIDRDGDHRPHGPQNDQGADEYTGP